MRAPGRVPPCAPALSLALAGMLSLALAGCHRKPDIIPGSSSDSTQALGADSGAVELKTLADRWETPDQAADAARLTGEAVLQDLRAHALAEPELVWQDRARELLDSLGIGAELASARCVMAANFFSRGNPDGGSWAWAYWCGRDGIQGQAIQGGGMTLLAAAGRGLFGQPPVPPGAPGVAVLFGRRGITGALPLLYVFKPRDRGLELTQTLGPDSLGGSGTGTFEAHGDTVQLVTRTFRPTPHFDECPACPHVTRVHRFAWLPGGFARVSDVTVPTPYASFVELIAALASGNRDAAMAHVTDPTLVDAAQRAMWDQPHGTWRVAPQTDASATDIVFYRGAKDAWRVHFTQRDNQWVMTAFEPTERGAIE
ncbi:MAG TPA: hypothetical protein VFK69_08235 [Candidatus Eisenbacteria bacterium]|nr:hypothetical protein [Candidatus Eisenbacteria bacterium]